MAPGSPRRGLVQVICATSGAVTDAKAQILYNRIGHESITLALHVPKDAFDEICVSYFLGHALSLRRSFRRSGPVDSKLHHYRILANVGPLLSP